MTALAICILVFLVLMFFIGWKVDLADRRLREKTRGIDGNETRWQELVPDSELPLNFISWIFVAVSLIGIAITVGVTISKSQNLNFWQWTGLIAITAFNWVLYFAFFLRVIDIVPQLNKALRLYGRSFVDSGLRTFRLYRRTQMNLAIVGLSLLMVTLLVCAIALIKKGGLYYSSGAFALFAIFASKYMEYYFLPPSLLILSSSTPQTLEMLVTVRGTLDRHRVAALLNRDEASSESVRQHDMFDNFRTQNDADWQEIVLSLTEMVPIIVLDTRHTTPGVLFEVERIIDSGRLYKTIILTGDDGECPALKKVLTSNATHSHPVVVSTEEELPTILSWMINAKMGRVNDAGSESPVRKVPLERLIA